MSRIPGSQRFVTYERDLVSFGFRLGGAGVIAVGALLGGHFARNFREVDVVPQEMPPVASDAVGDFNVTNNIVFESFDVNGCTVTPGIPTKLRHQDDLNRAFGCLGELREKINEVKFYNEHGRYDETFTTEFRQRLNDRVDALEAALGNGQSDEEVAQKVRDLATVALDYKNRHDLVDAEDSRAFYVFLVGLGEFVTLVAAVIVAGTSLIHLKGGVVDTDPPGFWEGMGL